MGHVACKEERDVYRVLVGKPEERRVVVRCYHGQKSNIRMDLK